MLSVRLKACSAVLFIYWCLLLGLRTTFSFRQTPKFLHRFVHSVQASQQQTNLDSMRVAELRVLLRSYGGIPGTAKKATLVALCRQFSTGRLPSTPFAAAAISVPQPTSDAAGCNVPSNTSQLSVEGVQIPIPDPSTATASPKRWRRPSPDDRQLIPQQNTRASTRTLPTSIFNNHNPGDKRMARLVERSQAIWDDSYRVVPELPQYHHPGGANRDQRVANTSQQGEMDITFLGTASCQPGITRGVSSVALRYNGAVWLFDCGEGTQMQLRKSKVRESQINKIFITHMHGDHAFGLAGVLCMIGQTDAQGKGSSDEEDQPKRMDTIDIYGPEGIRNFIRTSLQMTYSRVAVPHRIHELKELPIMVRAGDGGSGLSSDAQYGNGQFNGSPGYVKRAPTIRYDSNFGERDGGRDIYPNRQGVYELCSENGLTVTAAPMSHTVPCAGFVVQEHERDGALRPHVVSDVMRRNKAALQAQHAAENAGLPKHKTTSAQHIYAKLKALLPEESYTFPDGTTVFGKDVVGPRLPGRKVVYMGDTNSGDRIAAIAESCDVLIHEATNAFHTGINAPKVQHASYGIVETFATDHGHSTPEIAGRFAARINARRLLLTHFSGRYSGEDSLRSMAVMWEMEEMARRAWLHALPEGERSKLWAEYRSLHAEQQQGGGEGSGSGSGGDGGDREGVAAGTGAQQAAQDTTTTPTDSTTSTTSTTTTTATTTVNSVPQYGPLAPNGVIAAWDWMNLNIPLYGAVQRSVKGKIPFVNLRPE